MQFLFADHTLDTDRRELRRGVGRRLPSSRRCSTCWSTWCRTATASSARTISSLRSGAAGSSRNSTLTSRINAARKAVGDSGEEQKLIRTIARKGLRFVGDVRAIDADRAGATTAAADEIHEPSRAALPLPDRPAIAVLPFVNMSGDPEQEYFSDGISEDIITALSKLRWFFVIARNSSFTYKGKAVHMKQIAEELGVGYVVEGSVRKGGDRVRITASSTTSPPAATSGRSATTASSPTCSRCRTRSPRPSSPRSSRSSTPRKTFAPSASRPTVWTPGIW